MKMQMTYQVPIIEKREYVLLKRLVSLSHFYFDSRPASQVKALSDMLKSAKVLDEEDMPSDIVRLYTTVTVSQFERSQKSFQIVLPDAADSLTDLESILSPISVACFGLSLESRFELTINGSTENYIIRKLEQSKMTKNAISTKHPID